jgi:hypothetical protein
MARAKPLIDIKWSPFQEGYKGSMEALPPMRTVPAATHLVKVRAAESANTVPRKSPCGPELNEVGEKLR